MQIEDSRNGVRQQGVVGSVREYPVELPVARHVLVDVIVLRCADEPLVEKREFLDLFAQTADTQGDRADSRAERERLANV